MTDIFKVKIGLSPEHMNGIFEFTEKRHLCEYSHFKPNYLHQTFGIETEKLNLFPNECEAII